jgi:ABC-type multidrug transport system permease subunit
MRAAWLIARKDLRLLVRDKMALFWVFVFPVGFALFFGSVMKAGVDAEIAPMSVVLVLESEEPIAEAVQKTLAESGVDTRRAGYAEAQRAVQRADAAAYVRVSADPMAPIELGIDPSRRAQSAMLHGLLLSALMPRLSGLPPIETKRMEQQVAGPRSGYEIVLPAMLIWGMIGCVATFAISLASERATGTLLRLRSAPISRATILGGKSLACALTCGIDLLLLSVLGYLGFGVHIDDMLKYGSVLIACTACFTGLTMTLSVLGKSEQAVAGAGWSSLIVLAMLGGAMVPPSVMPAWLLRVSNVSPVKWGIWALEGATWRALTWQELMQPLAMLFALGALGFGAGVAVLMAAREL